MQRQKRAMGSSEENHLWANPCDYNNSNTKPVQYSPRLAKEVASQARTAVKSAAAFKDEFARKLHSYRSFQLLLEQWTTQDYLRTFPWFRSEMLPKEKSMDKPISDEYLNGLMGKIDEILPVMYKGLKVIVAGLDKIISEDVNDGVIQDEALNKNIFRTMHNVRGVLCLFSEIMGARNLQILPLMDSEIPAITIDNRLSMGLLIYRDTLIYLEYLSEVFQKMYDTKTA